MSLVNCDSLVQHSSWQAFPLSLGQDPNNSRSNNNNNNNKFIKSGDSDAGLYQEKNLQQQEMLVFPRKIKTQNLKKSSQLKSRF